MTSVIKQLLINNIPLPYDMLNEIKEYAFIDTVSYNSKCIKNIVHNTILNAPISSIHNINLDALWYDPENDPWVEVPYNPNWGIENNYDEEILLEEENNNISWNFWTGNNEDKEFNANFCKICGNYVKSMDEITVCDNILCQC